ncbi:MAG: SurA N-terminal domain-containing protein [Proteobacteria bacterium]|nr:hypothetical protein [Desulfobulbaceae bacterium]MBU4153906.1 SurA N-terminal domain-containing protein [Pseudomonadota bacterium]
MLGLFRRKAQSPTLQVTIVIIILVFIFWGVGTNDNNATLNAVATVNDETISVRDYQKQYEQTVNSLRDQFGGSIPSGLLDQLNIKQQVVDKLVQSTLLRQGAVKMGIYISDQELQNAIKEMEAFKINGIFDVKRYEEILTGSRMTISQFEQSMRYDLLATKVLDHLGRFGHISPIALKDIFNYQYHDIKLDYVALKADSYQDKVEKTDATITAFYDEHKAQYMSDPLVKIKYILFPVADFKESAAPSDDQIAQFYQANSDRYSIPERRRARHILIKTNTTDPAETKEAARKRIDDVAAKLKAGESFADLAKKYSEDGTAAQGGDLGLFGRGQMVKPFEDAVYALKEGQVSEVVETNFGLHLIKMETIEPEKRQTLEEVKSAITEQLAGEEAKNKAFQGANDAYEQIIMVGSLAKFVEDQGADSKITITTTEPFPQAKPPKELQDVPELVNSAFTLNKGELSSIIDTGKGFAIILVDDKITPSQQELTTVRDKVEADFIASESTKLAKEAAESLLATVKSGNTLAEEAKKLGLDLQSTPFISRASYSEANTLPQQIAQEALILSENNSVLDKVAEDNSTFYVVAYNSSQEPDQTLFAEKKEELETNLAAERKNDLVTAWLDTLRQKATITTKPELL